MTSTDPITGALVAKGAEAAIATTNGIIQRLLGPAADEIGEMLRDKVRTYRSKNAEKALQGAQALIEASLVEVKSIPLRLLLPLIEGASLEEDDSLSVKWAGLLASAASINVQQHFHPSFPRILSELTSREAALLDRLSALGGENDWPSFRTEMVNIFECTEDSINESNGNIVRLGLWVLIQAQGTTSNRVKLTPFGKSFLAAAQGPGA